MYGNFGTVGLSVGSGYLLFGSGDLLLGSVDSGFVGSGSDFVEIVCSVGRGGWVLCRDVGSIGDCVIHPGRLWRDFLSLGGATCGAGGSPVPPDSAASSAPGNRSAAPGQSWSPRPRDLSGPGCKKLSAMIKLGKFEGNYKLQKRLNSNNMTLPFLLACV